MKNEKKEAIIEMVEILFILFIGTISLIMQLNEDMTISVIGFFSYLGLMLFVRFYLARKVRKK